MYESVKISIVLIYLITLIGYSYSFFSQKGEVNRYNYLIFTLTFAAMSMYLTFISIERERCPFGNGSESLYFIAWLLTGLFWFGESINRPFQIKEDDRSIRILMLPLVFSFAVISLMRIDIEAQYPATLSGFYYPLHVFSILIAYAFYLLSFISIAAYQKAIVGLKSKEKTFFSKRLPPLATLQRQTTLLLCLGNILLPLGIVFGFLWTIEADVQNPSLQIKTIAAIISWIFFTAALVIHFYKLKSTRFVYGVCAVGLIVTAVSFIATRHGI